jgi:hypothetical protein
MAISLSDVADCLRCARPELSGSVIIEAARSSDTVRSAWVALWARDAKKLVSESKAVSSGRAAVSPNNVDHTPSPGAIRAALLQRVFGNRFDVTTEDAQQQQHLRIATGLAEPNSPLSHLTTPLGRPPQAASTSRLPNDPFTSNGATRIAAVPAPLSPGALQHSANVDDSQTQGDDDVFGWYLPCSADVKPLQLLPRGDDFALNTCLASTNVYEHFRAGKAGWRCASMTCAPKCFESPDARALHEWSPRPLLLPVVSSSNSREATLRLPPAPWIVPSVRRWQSLELDFGDVFSHASKRCSIAHELHRLWLETYGTSHDVGLDPLNATTSLATSTIKIAKSAIRGHPPVTQQSWSRIGETLVPLIRAISFNRLLAHHGIHNISLNLPLWGKRLLCLGLIRIRVVDFARCKGDACRLIADDPKAFTLVLRSLYVESHAIRFVLRPGEVSFGDGVVNGAKCNTDDDGTAEPLCGLLSLKNAEPLHVISGKTPHALDHRPPPWDAPRVAVSVDPGIRQVDATSNEPVELQQPSNSSADAEKRYLNSVMSGEFKIRIKSAAVVIQGDYGYRVNGTSGVLTVSSAAATIQRFSIAMHIDGRPVASAIARTIATTLRPLLRGVIEKHISASLLGSHELG